jgi:hypothetical protein
MANQYRALSEIAPQEYTRMFKDLGVTDPNGNEVFAPVVALEPASVGGGGSNTQYAEGVTQATPTGTVVLWRDAGNVLHTANPSNGLPVNIVAGAGSGGTASNFGSADPSAGTAAGYSDGANMREARVFDEDTGAGTQYVLGASIRLAGNGGSVEGGTASNPLRTDPTGTTTQPVSGTVTSNQGGAPWTINQTQWAGTAVDVNSGNKSAGTVRVVLATDQPALTNALHVVVDSLPSNLSNPSQKFSNVAASTTDSSLVAAVAAKVIYVVGAVIVCGGTATSITFNSKPAGAGTAISATFALGANGGFVWPCEGDGTSLFQTNSGEGLTVTTGAGSTVGIQLLYVQQ